MAHTYNLQSLNLTKIFYFNTSKILMNLNFYVGYYIKYKRVQLVQGSSLPNFKFTPK
jgi:hypothetical protein